MAVSAIFACLAAAAVDGDTLRCANVPEAGGRVRLARIDAPERGEQGHDAATRLLASRLTRPVTCYWADAHPYRRGFQAHDSFGRRVAWCFAGGIDLGDTLLRANLARPWP